MQQIEQSNQSKTTPDTTSQRDAASSGLMLFRQHEAIIRYKPRDGKSSEHRLSKPSTTKESLGAGSDSIPELVADEYEA